MLRHLALVMTDVSLNPWLNFTLSSIYEHFKCSLDCLKLTLSNQNKQTHIFLMQPLQTICFITVIYYPLDSLSILFILFFLFFSLLQFFQLCVYLFYNLQEFSLLFVKNYILTSNSTRKQYKEKHSISILKFQRFQTPSVINRYVIRWVNNQ